MNAWNGDESRHRSTHHVHGCISVFSNKNLKTKSTLRTLKYAQVHSSAEQNLSYNFETVHHARAVKSPTAVIFEDTKHKVEENDNDKAQRRPCA